MNTLAFSTSIKPITTFELVPKNNKILENRALMFYLMVFFPLLIISAILYNAFQLREMAFIIAIIIMGIVLVNIYFYYITSKTRAKQVTLTFEFGEIILAQNGQILNRIDLEKLEYKQLNWGMDENLPAIQISGANFPKLRIGYTQSSLNFNEMETTRDCTDFLVNSEKEWQQLLSQLNKAKQHI